MAKIIRCKKCGEEFKKPIFGEKKMGFGIGFTAMGDSIVCPNCKNKDVPKNYEVVEDK